MPQAIEEGLRWEPPLLGIMRTATRDTEVEGVSVPAGATISVSIGSANHDEKYWENAEEFDIFRPQKQHLAFAWGPHMCLGLHLARMETKVAAHAAARPAAEPAPRSRRRGRRRSPAWSSARRRAPRRLGLIGRRRVTAYTDADVRFRTRGTAMRLEDLVLVSVDDHVVEPPDLFEGRLSAEYADARAEAHPQGQRHRRVAVRGRRSCRTSG